MPIPLILDNIGLVTSSFGIVLFAVVGPKNDNYICLLRTDIKGRFIKEHPREGFTPPNSCNKGKTA